MVNIEHITSEVKKLKIYYQRQFNFSRKLVFMQKLFPWGPLSIKSSYHYLYPLLSSPILKQPPISQTYLYFHL